MINDMKLNVAIDLRYVENEYSGLSRFSINVFDNLLNLSNEEEINYSFVAS